VTDWPASVPFQPLTIGELVEVLADERLRPGDVVMGNELGNLVVLRDGETYVGWIDLRGTMGRGLDFFDEGADRAAG
jgi:hypothetical protein